MYENKKQNIPYPLDTGSGKYNKKVFPMSAGETGADMWGDCRRCCRYPADRFGYA